MEETYDEAAAFWQALKKELVAVVAEKMAFLSRTGVREDVLDLSSEDERMESDLDGLDNSDTESVTVRRR